VPETDDPVNQARSFSGAGEKPGRKERKRTHQDDPTGSPQFGRESMIVRKYLAFLGIVREDGANARRAQASTTGD
jgi:hypothetical protein